jgi:ABC-type antimicrobial peptide transport system permease subunit
VGIAYSNIIIQLVGGMGVLGMALSTVGLYGLVAYSVSRRTREIGIRMALGARRETVVRMVLWQGLRLALAGIIAGLLGARFVCPMVTSAFALRPAGTLMFVVIPVPLLLVTILASWAPARRAARVDPLTALHEE